MGFLSQRCCVLFGVWVMGRFGGARWRMKGVCFDAAASEESRLPVFTQVSGVPEEWGWGSCDRAPTPDHDTFPGDLDVFRVRTASPARRRGASALETAGW